jgi:uncharacterized membrane protein YfhO
MGTFFGNETNRIISLGQQTEGTDVSLTLTLVKDNFYAKNRENYFYYIDWAVFEDAFARLAQNQFQVTEHTERTLDGTFTSSKERELVLTTIPFDKGWQITVDGNSVEPIKVMGSLLAFYVDGETGATHEISLDYCPNTLLIGIAISLFSLAILFVLIVLDPLMKRRKILRAVVSIPDYPAPTQAVDEDAEELEEELPQIPSELSSTDKIIEKELEEPQGKDT